VNTELPEIKTYSYISDNTSPINHSILNDRVIGPGTSNRYSPWSNPIDVSGVDDLINNVINKKGKKMADRRLVKVLVVDPDPKLDVELAVLVNTPEKITDLDDQELFFELDIKHILDNHNDVRTTFIDKKASKKSGETEYLEPIRIRDLKMLVITIAEF